MVYWLLSSAGGGGSVEEGLSCGLDAHPQSVWIKAIQTRDLGAFMGVRLGWEKMSVNPKQAPGPPLTKSLTAHSAAC
jgi:hypothetical protein